LRILTLFWKKWFINLDNLDPNTTPLGQRYFIAQMVITVQIVTFFTIPLIYVLEDWNAILLSIAMILGFHLVGCFIAHRNYNIPSFGFLLVGNFCITGYALLSPGDFHLSDMFYIWAAFPLYLINRHNRKTKLFFVIFSLILFLLSREYLGVFANQVTIKNEVVNQLLHIIITSCIFSFLLLTLYKIIKDNDKTLLAIEEKNQELIESDEHLQITLAKTNTLMASLEDSKMRMELALGVSRIGIWEYSILVQEMIWDQGMHNLCGISEEDYNNQFYTFKNLILEDDKKYFLDQLQDAINEERELNIVFRILRPDGEIRHVNFISRLTFSEEDELTQMIGVCWDLTKELQQEQLLTDTQQLLERTSEISGTGGWEQDLVNQNLKWSTQIRKILAVPNDFTPEENTLFSFVHPNYRRTILRLMDSAINLGESWDTIIRIIDFEGANKWVRSIGIPQSENGQVFKITGAYQDITEETNSATEKEFFFNMSVEMFGITSGPDYHFSYLNSSWKKILGWSEEDLKAKSIFEFIHSDDHEQFTQRLNQLSEDGFINDICIRMRTASNDYFWISWNISYHEETEQIYCVCRNISSQKNYEAELIAAREKAIEAANTKSIFLSTMSHEIRTPMNAVIGMTQLLLEEKPREDQLENLEILNFSANNLLALINDILDFNKIESGQITFENIPFQIERLISNIHSTFKKRSSDQNTIFSAQLDNQLPHSVVGDITRVTQILNNIIGNAIKFTENGLVTLEISQLSNNDGELMVQFLIRDTGIGIASENLDKIFDNFSQADATITRKFGGTGLGLSICKKLSELQGGKIWVESEVGVGSQFYIQLPFQSSQEAIESAKPVEVQIDYSILEGKKILVAEDNKINFTLVKKILGKKGIVPDHAVNGKEALISVQKDVYDFVLMDVQMPVMDGYEATKAIRKLGGRYENLPIIALTADVLEDVKLKVDGSGMNGYVPKPLNPQLLFSKMCELLTVKSDESKESNP
jgi:PAS domain S-box-containing protein